MLQAIPRRDFSRRPHATLRRAAPGILPLVILVTFSASELAASVEPFAAPILSGCTFLPAPGEAFPAPCGEDNTLQPAFLRTTIRFNVDVSDADAAEDMIVTYSSDHLCPSPTGGVPNVNPDSPVRTEEPRCEEATAGIRTPDLQFTKLPL